MDINEILTAIGILASVGLALYAKSESKEAKLKAANAEALAEGSAARDRERIERERIATAQKNLANQTRIWMFAEEAVGLHSRWILYARQASVFYTQQGINPEAAFSASRPFEWIGSSMIEEYLQAGGHRDAIRALRRVKQLNAQVTRQLDDVHAGKIDGIGRILAFVFSSDEWKPTCESIRTLLRFAEEAGNDVAALREAFDAQFREGELIQRHTGL